MFNEFLDNYKRKIKLPYIDNDGETQQTQINIKPLSINDLMYIVDDQTCGYLLIKLIDGIDITKDPEEVKDVVQKFVINPDYAKLFYAVVACCTSVKSDSGEYISLKETPENVEVLPFDVQLDILNNILELSMPVDLKRFSNNVKKIQTRMFKKE